MPEERLTSRVLAVTALDAAMRERLLALHAAHYDGVERERFFADLDEKDAVILLEANDEPAGFSTQKVFDITIRGRRVRILFSGDTVIDPRWWGSQELVRSWCRFAGSVKGEEPETPLYWFLISKGHRTYLYLPLFFLRFHPSCDGEASPFDRELLDAVASMRFGDRYDSARGLIDAERPLDRLRPEIDSAALRSNNRHVAFFVERNPRYGEGVELACIAEIAPENMRSFARREVESGVRRLAAALPAAACRGARAPQSRAEASRRTPDAWLAFGEGDARAYRAALETPRAVQERILLDTLARNARSDYGRRHRFAAIASVDEYRRRVPSVTYDDIAGDIARVANGETNVLTTEPVLMMERTSGSTSASKLIPFTASFRREIMAAVWPWMHDLYARHPALRDGRAYWAISPLAGDERTAGGLPVGFGDESEYFDPAAREALLDLLAVPPSVARIGDLEESRRETLRHLAEARDLAFVSVWHPSFLTILMKDLAPRDLWPDLRVISCWGDAAAALALPHLEAMFDGVVIQKKGLMATEGVVSIPFGGQHPLAISSHFLEFVDMESGNVCLADELRDGREYRVILTTGGGLYRYDLADVVRVTGRVAATPSIEFIGRDGDVVDLTGEKLSEPFVRDALSRCNGSHFAFVAPEFGDPPRYVLFIDSHEDVAAIAARLERELQANPHYRYCRRAGQLGPLVAVRLRAGAEDLVLRMRARDARFGQVKPRALEKEPWRERLAAAGGLA
ncbi:MAG TPA: GH3 auxin-responsive promoter family protein [Thermoanaerobaculia bacterium]|nr:GH3 auxin-responsive promoter family protein [Thermoanaerobaculia bacterium]